MRNKNLATGVQRKKNSFNSSSLKEEGVFETSRGKFVVKVIVDNKSVMEGSFDTDKEAIDHFNILKSK